MNVVSTDWRIHFVFFQHVQWSVLCLVGKVVASEFAVQLRIPTLRHPRIMHDHLNTRASPKKSEIAEKHAANEDLESMEIPTGLLIADRHTNAELQENLLRDYEHKFVQTVLRRRFEDC